MPWLAAAERPEARLSRTSRQRSSTAGRRSSQFARAAETARAAGAPRVGSAGGGRTQPLLDLREVVVDGSLGGRAVRELGRAGPGER